MLLPKAHELAAYTLEAQHPLTRTWVDDTARVDLLAQQHEIDVLLATDLSIAAKRARRFAADAPPEELLNRWVGVNNDLNAMVSIRYEGEDPQKPFVDATPLSHPLSAEDVPSLCRAAQDIYGPLQPRYLRLWSSERYGWIQDSGPDKRFMAAQLKSLRRGTGLRLPTDLVLTSARSMENCAKAQRAYDAVRAAHPNHSQQSALQSFDDLNETLEAGLLFDVTVGGTWAGYVAAMSDGDTLGLPAYVVQELILTPEFRGRGYGPHLTTLLARALPDRDAILLGTIHADNRGAIQAAIAAGRIDVGGWIQIPLR